MSPGVAEDVDSLMRGQICSPSRIRRLILPPLNVSFDFFPILVTPPASRVRALSGRDLWLLPGVLRHFGCR